MTYMNETATIRAGGLRDFTTVTESPGIMASREQLERLYTRYIFASGYCNGGETLEVACGTGIGLGLLARHSGRVVGGDIDPGNLEVAKRTYGCRSNIEVRRIDAHSLPFSDSSFDLIVLYEAIYYLEEPLKFIKEARRVLKNGGTLLICSVNREWAGFNPSPFSRAYYSASELCVLLNGAGYRKVETFADSPAEGNTLKETVVRVIKRSAVALDLIPKTMKGKEVLKRVFFGKLTPLPAELKEEKVEYARPVPIGGNATNSGYKVIYAAALK